MKRGSPVKIGFYSDITNNSVIYFRGMHNNFCFHVTCKFNIKRTLLTELQTDGQHLRQIFFEYCPVHNVTGRYYFLYFNYP